ncbi:oligopeptide/dipeptide ABC transporter ATP-binding protein [Epibacterium ulvae]|uniref:oligopeptide/dipeptide ABC transporter ATP-binding protein n=1 Tax=Epibacterium ulvae TaxID=1156985 RepID=UPI0024929378|nr:oligopeptide/dipeptide ABC transporter ATP-binding protein [Epibacterium ulvae]
MYLGQKIEEALTSALFSSAQHPYIYALLVASLIPDPNIGLPKQLLGAVAADPFVVHRGCLFAPRCPVVQDSCLATSQELRSMAVSSVRCDQA